MKHFSSALLALLYTASLFTTSCKKTDEGSSTQDNLNAKERLIVGSWSVESKLLIYTDFSGNTNTIDHMEACEKDDIYTFTNDKMYRVTDGSNSCNNLGSKYKSPFGWAVLYDSVLQFVDGPALGAGYPVIQQLDNTTLKIRTSVPPNGQEYFVYKRK